MSESPAKVEPRLMREIHRARVLEVLRDGGPLSRVQLSRRTNLSKPTVSEIVDALLTEGLVKETGASTSSGRAGRPAALLTFDASAISVIGVRFGVHTTEVALADGRGHIVAREQTFSRKGDPQSSFDDVAKLARRLLKQAGSRVASAGVCVPGLVHSSTGECALAPNLGWSDVPVASLLEQSLDVPVVVANTTHAAALAEGRLGAARGIRSFVWVYTGTGVGAGIVVDGRIFSGSDGFAGEIGHSPVTDGGPQCACGKHGCLETLAGATALERGAVEALGQPMGAARVAAAAAEGHEKAAALLQQAGGYLGRGVATLTNLLNPGLVVIGGPLAGAGEIYVKAIRDSVAMHTLAAEAVPIELTTLGPDSPLLGVIQIAADRAAPAYRIVAS